MTVNWIVSWSIVEELHVSLHGDPTRGAQQFRAGDLHAHTMVYAYLLIYRNSLPISGSP